MTVIGAMHLFILMMLPDEHCCSTLIKQQKSFCLYLIKRLIKPFVYPTCIKTTLNPEQMLSIISNKFLQFAFLFRG